MSVIRFTLLTIGSLPYQILLIVKRMMFATFLKQLRSIVCHIMVNDIMLISLLAFNINNKSSVELNRYIGLSPQGYRKYSLKTMR